MRIKPIDHIFIRLVSFVVTLVMILPIKDSTISMVRYLLGMLIMVPIAIWFFINSRKDIDKIKKDKNKDKE